MEVTDKSFILLSGGEPRQDTTGGPRSFLEAKGKPT